MERDRGEKEIMSEIEISPELLLDKGFMELLGESPESMEDIRQERELKVKDALLAGKILGEYQENIRKSETDKEAILKGLISGEPMSSLLYRALDIIGRLTGDKVFSETARKRGLYLYEVYEDEETIDELIKETGRQIERLREARRENTEPSRDSLISKAIERHLERLEELVEKKDKIIVGRSESGSSE